MSEVERNEAKARGGYARSEALSPEQRRDIARRAASARWDGDIPRATHEGNVQIGNATLSAAVLPNTKRLLTQATFYRAIGRSRSPKAGTGILSTVDGIPFFLQASVLRPFLTDDLLASTTPIFFLDKNGARGVGYDAELLPKVAEVYLKFRDACAAEGKPIPSQYDRIIKACDMVMRGLARVGIVALVDEATGFQDDRSKRALAEILENFIAEQLRPWLSTFPAKFYREMFRLKGMKFDGSTKRPRYIGKLTNDLVYRRLAPGVLEKLQEKNPADERGRRKSKHHQWLTDHHGHPELRTHLETVTALMIAADSWDQFYTMLNRARPIYRGPTLFDGIDD